MIVKAADLISATSRSPYNMSFSHGDTVGALDNRKSFLNGLGIDYRDLVCARQVHGSQIRMVEESDKGKGAMNAESAFSDTDALITSKLNLPLAVFTADCLPVFLWDPFIPAIGLVHAGWRGTKELISLKAVQLMQSKYHTCVEDLRVSFGPAIRSCCYQVGENFKELFSYGLSFKDGRNYFDLVAENIRQLKAIGVRDEFIQDSGICTVCNSQEFFSYRRQGPASGRMMSVAMLKASG